jgi:hypothetical protein
MKAETLKRITSGLRFRLTLSYALFSALLLAGSGMIFRTLLEGILNQNIRQNLDQEWAAMKGFLRIKEDSPKWFYDRADPNETYAVSRLQRVYLLTTAQGSVLQSSDTYASLGEDTPDEVRTVLLISESTWKSQELDGGLPAPFGRNILRRQASYPYFVAIG